MYTFLWLVMLKWYPLCVIVRYVEMISFIFNISLHWNLLTMFHKYSFEYPYGSLNILCHYLCLGLVWKLTFSSPMTSAEFSKFAGILRAALSQHHLSHYTTVLLEVLYCKINFFKFFTFVWFLYIICVKSIINLLQ